MGKKNVIPTGKSARKSARNTIDKSPSDTKGKSPSETGGKSIPKTTVLEIAGDHKIASVAEPHAVSVAEPPIVSDTFAFRGYTCYPNEPGQPLSNYFGSNLEILPLTWKNHPKNKANDNSVSSGGFF